MHEWLSYISPSPRLSGDFRSDGHWIEPLRIIYDHELVLFRDGDFIVEFEEQQISCKADSFIIVPPGLRHVSRAVSPNGGHRYWIHFDWVHQGPRENTPTLTYLPGRIQKERLRPTPSFVPREILHGPIFAPTPILDLHQRFSALLQQNTPHAQQIARARLLELLVELLVEQENAASTATPEPPLPSQIRSKLELLAQKSIADMPSIQRYLEELGYSYAHLCRCFHHAYGLSPLQYVNTLRIERAKWLIRDTQLPISGIARSVGHDNPAYFCRQFRKHTGQSPSEYADACPERQYRKINKA